MSISKQIYTYISIFLLISIGTAYLFFNLYKIHNEQVLSVHVLDVGQGDAILLRTPNKNLFLVDVGPTAEVVHSLEKVLPVTERTLDGVLLTHFDLDHVGGLQAVLNTFEVSMLVSASTTKHGDVVELAKASAGRSMQVTRGDIIILDAVHGVRAEVLAPGNLWVTNEENDMSIVLRLTYGATCFLLMGDASVAVERELVYQYGSELNCDVLKVGHHGSQTSTSKEFLGYVSPTYAAVSVGNENTFGHPHQDVLNTLSDFAVTVLQTNVRGTLTFVSDGVDVILDE